MGLSSAMTTALTGMNAAEIQIDVAGNNLANSQTVGYKASDVIFATQFLRTFSPGSQPTDTNGGTNPMQTGLGVKVAAITPNFSQGTIEVSSNTSDLAIQGEGFFIVEGPQYEPLYTRNGIFNTNSQNELVSSTGNRLLGFGVDEYYNLQTTQLVPLIIPMGTAASAQATRNVYLNGNLTPTGDVADTAKVIDSDILYADALGATRVLPATLLTNVFRCNDLLTYDRVFEVGELQYTGRKDGNALTTKTLDITPTTTVGDYLQFVASASGIQTSPLIPPSINRIPGDMSILTPGARITDALTSADEGRLRVVSNNGTGNAVEMPYSSFLLLRPDGTTTTPNVGFSTAQEALGQSASSNFIVYDSLGIPLGVRLTTVLQSRDSVATTYRWFADSGGNAPPVPDQNIAVGTGLVSFDGEGNMVQADDPVVNIERSGYPSTSPLAFNLNFSQVTGFATNTSTIAASRQDGSAVGTLTNYSVDAGGEVVGVFSNGISRTLGQVRMVRFANPGGLDQRGENMYGLGFNSGLPVQGNPGDMGLGKVVAGALELSNSDTGENLIELMLASTQYRANSRVISTAQTLLDDLLNMRR